MLSFAEISKEIVCVEQLLLLYIGLENRRCRCVCNVYRWCKLLRHEKLSHIVVVIVEAVGAADFVTFPECFPFLVDKFPMVNLSFVEFCFWAGFCVFLLL